MACDSCNCDDHSNRPCEQCLNCTQHLQLQADWDEIHDDQDSELVILNTKPRYKYNGKTGEITEVSAVVAVDDDDQAVVRQAFGL